jgi:broad specificity phosphatase PhoE
MKIRFPGGESNKIMAVRVIEAINCIYEANKDACVLIVTHSGPIATIFASYYGKNLGSTLKDKIGNEEVIELQIDSRLMYPLRARGKSQK